MMNGAEKKQSPIHKVLLCRDTHIHMWRQTNSYRPLLEIDTGIETYCILFVGKPTDTRTHTPFPFFHTLDPKQSRTAVHETALLSIYLPTWLSS